MFLTPQQLEDLTDYKRAADQCRWLRASGYQFAVSRTGKPKVLLSEVQRRLSEQFQAADESPNLDWLKRAG